MRLPNANERGRAKDSALLWTSRLAETVGKGFFHPPLTDTGRPFRNAKIRFKLEHLGGHFLRLGIPPQVDQSDREAAMGRRERGALSESPLGCGRRLIEPTKTDERDGHSQ